MRSKVKYLSKTPGDCATNIDISKINNENEIKFIQWTSILEDTITNLQQSVEYYDEFITQYVLDSKIFTKFHSFLNHFLMSLCLVISVDIGKLYSSDNDLCLFKYFKFCTDNNDIFKNDISNIIIKNRGLAAKLKTKYDTLFNTPRNKIYAHSDELLLKPNEVDKYISQVTMDDFKKFVEISKEILSSIWFEYNQHKMCFRLKGYKDYKKLLRLMCAHCDEDYVS